MSIFDPITLVWMDLSRNIVGFLPVERIDPTQLVVGDSTYPGNPDCTPNFHNKERRKGSIYLAANGAAEYRSHQDHCIVRCRDLEA